MATGHIARRTVAFFVVTSAPNFAAVVVAGLLTFVGVFPGDQSVIFTLVPAVIAAAVIEFAWLSPKLLRTFGKPLAATGRERWLDRARHGIRSGLRAAADGVDLAKALLRSHSFGVIVGSFSYLAFDIAALGFGFAAVGPVPPFGTLAMGYLIGQLGNLVPVPGGIGGTEGALVGMFAIYGVNVSDAVAAVFVYRLFQLAVPALLGAPAFILLRRKLMRKHDRALVCTPLSVDVVELPARS